MFSNNLENTLSKMDNILKQFVGIENNLFYEIVYKGVNVTKAIDTVAFKYDKDVSTLWKNYYPKVKEKIKELEKETSY